MNIRQLSPELAKIAKEELNEDPDRIEQDLTALRDWLAKQPHLITRTDDQWLVAFLRGCKFRLEVTKERLDAYYTLRTANPDICAPLDPLSPKLKEFLDTTALALLPKNHEDPRVILMRPGKINPENCFVSEILRMQCMLGIILFRECDNTTVSGTRLLMDLDGITFGHVSYMTPSLAKKLVTLIQDGTPVRAKGLHLINLSPVAEVSLGLVRNLLNEKNKARWFCHSKDSDDLYKYVPKTILPTEYGGDGGPMKDMIDDLYKTYISYRDYFLDEVNYKTDESKRVEKSTGLESIYGIGGFFRQLAFD